MATFTLNRAQTVINMERSGNGTTYYVPCKVNGLPLKMLFDTGADDVSMSLSEAAFMLKNGYLTENDLGRTTYYSIANGDAVEGMEINLREIEIGGLKLRNVKASIIKTLSAPLLLGQSAIQRLGPIQINGNKLIILNGESNKTDREYYLDAFQYNESKEYNLAIQSCKKGISIATSNKVRASLYFELGCAYHGNGDLNNAVDAYRTSLHYDLSSLTAYNLGVNYFELENNTQAYSAFKQCLNIMQSHKSEYLSGTEAACLSYMSEIDRKEGRLYDAERNALKSISIDPHSQTFFTLGEVYQEKKDYKKAVHYFELGVAFEPYRLSNVIYYSRMGVLQLGELSEYELGLSNIEKAIDIWDDRVTRKGRSYIPDDLNAAAYLAALVAADFYLFSDDVELSVKYLDKALEIRGDTAPPSFMSEMEQSLKRKLSAFSPYLFEKYMIN